MNTTKEKMSVEVWSDIMCPFCYIGKRRFEAALAESAYKDKIQLTWKSFQLDPGLNAEDNKDYLSFLQNKKGFSPMRTKEMLAQVTQMAVTAGLDFHFEKAIVANSFKAHRLAHLGKKHNRQDDIEEALFKAHFIEGKDISNNETLQAIAATTGIDATDTTEVLEGTTFSDAVKRDQQEAQEIGVSGVPFFVFDREYAISGAQDTTVFLSTINKAFIEWEEKSQKPELQITEGESCTPGGECT